MHSVQSVVFWTLSSIDSLTFCLIYWPSECTEVHDRIYVTKTNVAAIPRWHWWYFAVSSVVFEVWQNASLVPSTPIRFPFWPSKWKIFLLSLSLLTVWRIYKWFASLYDHIVSSADSVWEFWSRGNPRNAVKFATVTFFKKSSPRTSKLLTMWGRCGGAHCTCSEMGGAVVDVG